MIIISFVVCWIAVSAALAILGRHTLVGPIIIFLVSMFLTPLIAGLYVVIARLENRNIIVRGP